MRSTNDVRQCPQVTDEHTHMHGDLINNQIYIFNTVHHNKPNRYDYGEIEKNVTICNISRDKVL